MQAQPGHRGRLGDGEHLRVARQPLTQASQPRDGRRGVEAGQADLPVPCGLADRHVVVSNHRSVDPDLYSRDPHSVGVGSVDGHEGSSVRYEQMTATRCISPASDHAGTQIVMTVGRTLVPALTHGAEALPDSASQPPQQQPRPANPRLCVIRCQSRRQSAPRATAPATNSLNRVQPRPGEPTPSPPISFTSHNAHPETGTTRSHLPRPP